MRVTDRSSSTNSLKFSKSHDGKGANGSKNRPHDAYPVPSYYESCSKRVRVCQPKKCRQLKKVIYIYTNICVYIYIYIYIHIYIYIVCVRVCLAEGDARDGAVEQENQPPLLLGHHLSIHLV